MGISYFQNPTVNDNGTISLIDNCQSKWRWNFALVDVYNFDFMNLINVPNSHRLLYFCEIPTPGNRYETLLLEVRKEQLSNLANIVVQANQFLSQSSSLNHLQITQVEDVNANGCSN